MKEGFFSEGRIQFIIFFLAVFAIGLIWAYRKDIAKSKVFFKGSWKFLIGFVVVAALLQLLVKVLF